MPGRRRKISEVQQEKELSAFPCQEEDTLEQVIRAQDRQISGSINLVLMSGCEGQILSVTADTLPLVLLHRCQIKDTSEQDSLINTLSEKAQRIFMSLRLRLPLPHQVVRW